MFEEACRKGWEGVIAKRADSAVHAPRARRDWLKFKCEQGQELVIGGFTAPRGSRTEFGALLVGYYDGRRAALRRQGRHRLRPRDAARARRADARAAPATTRRSPTPPRLSATSRGSRPELVAQVGFAEWTRAGRLRHPRFLGLRDDKAAREVVREG